MAANCRGRRWKLLWATVTERAWLSWLEKVEVSERTIYRDIQDLALSGVPIQGEAGVGYSLPRGFDLPPMMFTAKEIEALVLGARIVASWTDRSLAKSAEGVLAKVEAVLLGLSLDHGRLV